LRYRGFLIPTRYPFPAHGTCNSIAALRERSGCASINRRHSRERIESMPTERCRALHIAAREGDTTTAQRLLREAAATYFTSAPAAPAVGVVSPHLSRRQPRTRHQP
jgi:hypothetical protein